MQSAPPADLTRGAASGIGARVRRLAGEGTWVRAAFVLVLLLTALLYVWGLNRNGNANDYYAAAVLAGTKSWKAFFFGAFDAGSYITVDKPPASLWLMALSGRIFGFNSWSMLLPEALLGVAAVGLLAAMVRRAAGPVAGLIAAVVMAATPVAVLMFRFNNPDALLTFLLVASAWTLMRAIENGRTRWLLLSAVIIGLAFLTKYLQAYIVLPAFIVTYFLLGPGGWARRFVQLLGAAGALLVSGGWWVAIVTLIPAGARPFIGGSTNNSVLDLVFGYDGFGRITGALGGFAGRAAGGAPRVFGGGGPGGGGGFGGQPGLTRLFNNVFGGEISWLLPLCAVAIVLGVWAHWRDPRPRLALAGVVLWGGWLLTHAIVFSFASGIVHNYYAIAMAPAVGGLVGPGIVDLWRLRSRSIVAGAIGAAALVVTAWWANQLLARTPDFLPWLGPVEMTLAVVASLLLVAPRSIAVARRLAVPALAVGLAAVLMGPTAYAIETASRPQGGAVPTSGPASAARPGGPGVGGFQYRRINGEGAPPAGLFGPGGNVTLPAELGPPAGFTPPAGGRFGAPGDGAVSSALLSYLQAHMGSATWLVAVSSANQGASIELATGKPVMAMGGFSGGDPAMTVPRLRQLVASGQLRYVLAGGGPGGFAGDNGGQSVMSWVQQHCRAVDYSGSGSTGLYDCSAAAAS